MARYMFRFRFVRVISLMTVILALFLVLKIKSSVDTNIKERQTFVDDLITRCGAVRKFYSLPSPTIPMSASRAIWEMKPVCDRTINVDPLEILRTCGHQPTLMSRKQVEKSNFDNGQAFLVPNVVHYVYNYDSPMTFLMYLSLLSVQRFIQPRYVILYGASLPYGYWWKRAAADVDNIYFVNMTSKLPTHIYGKKLWRFIHVSDMLRMEISYAIGGIYFDMDILAFRSFNGLRNYPFTLPRESDLAINNGIIISKPCQPFILHWIDNWRTFHPDEWADHSVGLTHRLSQGHLSDLINVEEDTLLGPTYGLIDELYKVGVKFNWTHQYSAHIWKYSNFKQVHVPESPEEIKQLNSTIGQMMRYVYTGKRHSTD